MTRLRYIGCRHVHLDVTDSTNDRAAAFTSDRAHGGLVVTAGRQMRGRGQHGRVWDSPPGRSVLLSALLFPPPELRRPALLTAFAAVSVSETIFKAIDLSTRIKWPNDVQVNGKKVAGILIECGVAAPNSPHAVVGIGLNVNQTADEFTRLGLADATSLSIAANRNLSVPEITALLIEKLDAEYSRLLGGELADLESRWRDGIGLLGKPVVAELVNGNQVSGRLSKLAFRGLCVVQPDDTTRHLSPEEVRHVHSAAADSG